MYVTSYLWAALFLVQASVTALIIHQTDYSSAYNYDQILPVVAIALGIIGTIAIGRYFVKKGRARGATVDVAASTLDGPTLATSSSIVRKPVPDG